MKRTVSSPLMLSISLCCALLLMAPSAQAKSSNSVSTVLQKQIQNDDKIVPLYEYTDSITATLSLSGGKAACSGILVPSSSDSASIAVKLYKKNGTRWDFIQSWSGSSTNGGSASAGGTVAVGSGTFKVVVSGNVGGKEFPTKSVTRSK